MTPQDALWAVSNYFGNTWWLVCAAFALPAAIIMLLKMVINEPFSALLVGRTFLMLGLFLFGVVPLNSGWLPFGVLSISIGGCMSAVLIATNWCNRKDKAIFRPVAMWNWVMSHFHERPVSQRTRR